MSDATGGIIHGASGGAIAGTHPARQPLRVLAGASTSDEFNTIQSAIFPIACFKLEDVRFDFDSSLLLPEVANETPVLKSLIDGLAETAKSQGGDARKPPLSVFGHTDPEGSDDYNKILGGRRAAVFYGLLTRRTEIWEDLYSNTQKFTSVNLGDKWGTRAVQIMLNALPPDPAIQPPPDPLEVDGQTGPKTQAAVKQFQSSQGISPSADAATRKALFLAYMNLLCVDEHGKSWQLDPKNDFLGHNVDSGGKADFQGCGEFNPLMLFSKDDLQAFDAAKDHTERDEKNRQNRRVMALLFRPGAKVSTKYWPCPKAKEDSTGCRDRFWSDGDQRRANGPEQREYKQTKDTFACRFYQRLVTGSPCEEDIKWTTLLIKLIDDRDKPYAGNAYRLEIGPLKLKGVTSGDGVVQELIPANATSGRLVMLFTPPQGQGDPTDFWSLDLEIVADLGASDTVAGAQARINNLGLFAGTQITGEADSLTVRALQRFQTRFKVQDDSGKPESSGKLTSQTASKLKEVYGS